MTIAGGDAERPRRRASGAGLSRERLRLWLRMLRASRGIEQELRERLRLAFDLTLPQFDVLAALARRDEGLTMTELSRYLMVSNGNVTGIIDRLVEVGLVERLAAPGDRRAIRVRLSAKGAGEFAAMAATHETWVDELLSRFGRAELASLIGQLDGLVEALRAREPRRATQSKGGKSR